jgi:hypothetical protein
MIANNTIVGCEYGIYAPDASPEVINCILWNNGDDLVGCSGSFLDTMDGDVGPGNISLDPLFRDATRGDFRLEAGSPCIDSGTSEMAPTLDSEGYVRWDDPNVSNTGGGPHPCFDMGAYESVADADGDGISDEWEIANGLSPGDRWDAEADADADGKSNREEYVSGTDPSDPSSCLRIVGLRRRTGESPPEDGSAGMEIEWVTVSGRNYQVFRAESISHPRGRRFSFEEGAEGGLSVLTVWKACSELMQGTGGVLSFFAEEDSTEAPPSDIPDRRTFYRVEVR